MNVPQTELFKHRLVLVCLLAVPGADDDGAVVAAVNLVAVEPLVK